VSVSLPTDFSCAGYPSHQVIRRVASLRCFVAVLSLWLLLLLLLYHCLVEHLLVALGGYYAGVSVSRSVFLMEVSVCLV